MNLKIEDYIDFKILFLVLSLGIAYKYIIHENEIIIKKNNINEI